MYQNLRGEKLSHCINGFDREAVFNSEVKPIIEQLVSACKRTKLPMVVAVCFYHEKCIAGEPVLGGFCSEGTWPEGFYPEEFNSFLTKVQSGPVDRQFDKS